MKGIKGITPYNQRLYAFVVNLKPFAFDVDVIPFIPFIPVISGFGMAPLLNQTLFTGPEDRQLLMSPTSHVQVFFIRLLIQAGLFLQSRTA